MLLDEPEPVEVCGDRAWSLESLKLLVERETRVVVGDWWLAADDALVVFFPVAVGLVPLLMRFTGIRISSFLRMEEGASFSLKL